MAVTKRDEETTFYVHVRNTMCSVWPRDYRPPKNGILGRQDHSSSMALPAMQGVVRVLSAISANCEISARNNRALFDKLGIRTMRIETDPFGNFLG